MLKSEVKNKTTSFSIEDSQVRESLRKIAAGLTRDLALQEDLMQEALMWFWQIARDKPGRTKSWYLQSCRFHLQHWLASGRSLDSLKRDRGENRVSIDGTDGDGVLEEYHTNGELFETVSARDLVSTLDSRLKNSERSVLRGLVEGFVLREIASDLNLSYPTALKFRRNIATLTIKLGICSPPANQNENGSAGIGSQ